MGTNRPGSRHCRRFRSGRGRKARTIEEQAGPRDCEVRWSGRICDSRRLECSRFLDGRPHVYLDSMAQGQFAIVCESAICRAGSSAALPAILSYVSDCDWLTLVVHPPFSLELATGSRTSTTSALRNRRRKTWLCHRRERQKLGDREQKPRASLGDLDLLITRNHPGPKLTTDRRPFTIGSRKPTTCTSTGELN